MNILTPVQQFKIGTIQIQETSWGTIVLSSTFEIGDKKYVDDREFTQEEFIEFMSRAAQEGEE
ncbi:MAG: hypothetical protein AAFQ92_19190 [Bacteroidota bacterium]